MPQAIVYAIVAIVTVAVGVSQIVAAKKEEKAMKEMAAKQATLEREKLDIVGDKRAVDTEREQARIRREARRKQATIASRALGSGIIGGSIVSEGSEAIASGRTRELDYLAQTNVLADRADATTSEQIAMDQSTARQRANQVGLQGTIAGISTAIGGFSKLGDIPKDEA